MSQPIPLPPFQAFLASNIPSVYDNTLSYYDELTKLIAYLEQQVVPAVNANTAGLDQLKSYVENYFKNLDVQEEINNKLDEMAESGELAEIIATYLELKAILAFDTPVALKAATNLIEGSYAKTYGYKRKDDGVYDLYAVRAKEESDTDDGYNTIVLSEDNTLVAIRLQPGTKRLIKLETSDNIQDYLSLDDEKEIVLPAGVTITVSDALLVNSNTTIDLNGSTINFSFNRSSIFNYDWDETIGFMGYGPNDTFTEYNGYKNITFKNGSIVGGGSCFMHNQNVTFDNVYFQTAGSRHSIQLAACKNFVVKNCTFEGAKDDDVDLASELIDIDKCDYNSQPYVNSHSAMYDNTYNTGVIVENNTFLPTNVGGIGYFSAVGTHGNSTTTTKICDGIIIRNNNFNSPIEYAIGIKNFDDVVIENNFLDVGSTGNTPRFILKRGILNKCDINNNVIKGVTSFFGILNPCYAGNNIDISNNLIIANDINHDSTGVLMMLNIHDSAISGNVIEYDHHPIHINTRAYFDSVDDNPEEHTINLSIEDNTFEKKIDSNSYFGNRISTCSDVKFINNDYIHDGTLQSNWYDFLFQGTRTNFVMQSNTSDTPDKFMPANGATPRFINNNALYKMSDTMSSTSTSGTFAQNATNFGEIIVSVGESSNIQNIELKPQPWVSNKIGGSETYKGAVAKNDGTYGSFTFTISNSGANWAYSGDLPIRVIYAKD